MSVSAFDGIFRSYTLARSARAASTDANGNPIAARIGVSLRAFLRASQNRALILRLGIDAQAVLVRGRCLEPLMLPSGVGVGTSFPLPWGGRAGVLTLEMVEQSPLPEIEDELGQGFYATWKAT